MESEKKQSLLALSRTIQDQAAVQWPPDAIAPLFLEWQRNLLDVLEAHARLIARYALSLSLSALWSSVD